MKIDKAAAQRIADEMKFAYDRYEFTEFGEGAAQHRFFSADGESMLVVDAYGHYVQECQRVEQIHI